MWLALAALTLAAAIGFNVLALAIQDPKRLLSSWRGQGGPNSKGAARV
jgi:hypothetical protein